MKLHPPNLKDLTSEQRSALAKELAEIILSSQKAEKMPSEVAKIMLKHYCEDAMATDAGLTALLEGAKVIESERTVELLKSLNLTHLLEG